MPRTNPAWLSALGKQSLLLSAGTRWVCSLTFAKPSCCSAPLCHDKAQPWDGAHPSLRQQNVTAVPDSFSAATHCGGLHLEDSILFLAKHCLKSLFFSTRTRECYSKQWGCVGGGVLSREQQSESCKLSPAVAQQSSASIQLPWQEESSRILCFPLSCS